MIAIADTSFVLAVGNRNDIHHKICVQAFKTYRDILLPASTLAEIAYMLGRSGGNERVAYFLFHLPNVVKYQVVALTSEDMHRSAELLQKYADTRVDFVDASIAAVAERLNITRILTLDQRDFSIIRPKHRDYFDLLPAKPQN